MENSGGIKNIWAEKYRPKILEEIILSDSSREVLDKIAIDGNMSHLLLQGPPGIGKTTVAKVIVNDILKCQHLYINASDESGIDTVRNKIIGFARTKSIDGNIKVIILDEADGITPDSQRALRNVMEEYSEYTKFILTANFKHRIIAPLQSRVQEIDLSPPVAGIVTRCMSILKSEDITVEKEDHLKFVELVRGIYPDIRKTINLLQKFSSSGKLNINKSETIDHVAEKVYSKLDDPLALRTYVIQHGIDFQNDYQTLLKTLLDIIFKKTDITADKKQDCILSISEHLYRAAFVVDQEINFTACTIQLNRAIFA